MKIGYDQDEGGSVDQPANGIYRCVVAAIVDVGLQPPVNEKEEPRKKVCVALEILSNAVTGADVRDSKGQRFTLFKDFNQTLYRDDARGKVSDFRKFLDTIHPNMVESMLKDTGDVDTDAWVCEGVLVATNKKGKYAKVESFMPWPDKSIPPKPEKNYAEPFGLLAHLLGKRMDAK